MTKVGGCVSPLCRTPEYSFALYNIQHKHQPFFEKSIFLRSLLGLWNPVLREYVPAKVIADECCADLTRIRGISKTIVGSSCEVNFGWQYTLGLLHDTDVEAVFVSEIRGAISVSYVER